MRTTTTLFAIGLGASLLAQSPYRPFPESNAGWVESHSFMSGGIGGGFTYTTCIRTIEFGSDTIIGSTPYRRLRIRGNCDVNQIQPWMPLASYSEPWSDLHYFRQNEVERKVYVWDTNAQQEVLWFDFSIGVGTYPPTFDNTVFTNGELQVVALDSTLLNDGYHRTWVLGLDYNGVEQDSAFCTIIEGVGTTYGLAPVIGLAPPFEWSDNMNCHSLNAVTLYPFGDTVCDPTTGVRTASAENTSLQAFPNPANEVLYLSSAVSGTVLDIHGHPIVPVQRSSAVVVGGLAKGAYVLRTVDGGTIRFVKE